MKLVETNVRTYVRMNTASPRVDPPGGQLKIKQIRKQKTKERNKILVQNDKILISQPIFVCFQLTPLGGQL